MRALLQAMDAAHTKADSAKEEIGWLKVVFAIVAAIDASLIGWLGQFYTTGTRSLVLLGIFVAAALSAYVVWINIVAYRKIRELKEM